MLTGCTSETFFVHLRMLAWCGLELGFSSSPYEIDE